MIWKLQEALINAGSQDAAKVKEGEVALKSWENQPGFHNSLISIVCSDDQPITVTYIAAIYFKNGIDKYWRKSSPM